MNVADLLKDVSDALAIADRVTTADPLHRQDMAKVRAARARFDRLRIVLAERGVMGLETAEISGLAAALVENRTLREELKDARQQVKGLALALSKENI